MILVISGGVLGFVKPANAKKSGYIDSHSYATLMVQELSQRSQQLTNADNDGLKY